MDSDFHYENEHQETLAEIKLEHKQIAEIESQRDMLKPYIDTSNEYYIHKPELSDDFKADAKGQKLVRDWLTNKFKNDSKMLDKINSQKLFNISMTTGLCEHYDELISDCNYNINDKIWDSNRSLELDEDGDGYLVAGLIPNNAYGEFYGASGDYKSTIMLDMLFCIAHGISYNGMEVKQGKIVYVAGEGLGGLGRRMKALETKYNIKFNDDNFVIVDGWDLADEEKMQKAELLMARLGSVEMLVVDTLNRNSAGAEENSASAWAKIMVNLDTHIKPYCNVIAWVHHTTKDGTTSRGTGARYGSSDFVFNIKRNGKNKVTMICTKMKEDEEPEPLQYKIVNTERSIVPELVATEIKMTDTEKAVLELVTDLGGELTQEQFKNIVKRTVNPDGNMKTDTESKARRRIRDTLVKVGALTLTDDD